MNATPLANRQHGQSSPQHLVAILILLSGLYVSVAVATPAGELDPGFGDHGRILLDHKRFEEMQAVAAFQEPLSGKLLIVADGWNRQSLLRFDATGTLDPTFGVDGALPLDFDGDSLYLNDVVRLPDGKFLIAAAMDVYGGPDLIIRGSFLLTRLHIDGTPDRGFGNNGRADAMLGGTYEVFSRLLVQPDGRIVVLGTTDLRKPNEVVLAQFTADGRRVTTFGGGPVAGVAFTDIAGSDTLASLTLQDDGKLIACGTTGTTNPSILVVRFNSNGSRDTSFGDQGSVKFRNGQNTMESRDCTSMPGGDLVIAGSQGSGSLQRAAVARLTPDGRLDNRFGDNGIAVIANDHPSLAQTLLFMNDGSVAIGGAQFHPNDYDEIRMFGLEWWPRADMLIARIDPASGVLDTAFGNHGMTTIDFGAGNKVSVAYPAQLMQQSDGKLVAVGADIDRYDWYYWPTIAIARLDPYGAGSNGWAGFANAHFTVAEGDAATEIRIKRTGGSTGSLTVDYRTVDSTAIAPSDYVAMTGTLAWPDGDMSDRSIHVDVVKDDIAEEWEYFEVELFNPNAGVATALASVAIQGTTDAGSSGGGGGGSGVTAGGIGAANTASGSSGGGAAGIEFLMLLALLRTARFSNARRSRLPSLGDGPGWSG